ncbi:hypothetical protein [Actinacidiphila bryophytorum]|uniref:hypothetical protein n=1 Tax=Actinacidiphila bryophytorum TaxID=1436133 RepID=UPI002176A199|nr:hypothetical protein [Actinacidiphila bryophytorum]UWE10019.1 hypothetical protein NYE86_15740 [Actinacidiphila bryophytorum]
MEQLFSFIESGISRGGEAEEILSEVCTDGTLRDCLISVSKEPESHGMLCYRHPNGFYKMKVLSPGTHAWALRIHLWDAPVPPSDVHDHRWNFASFVVSGQLQESQFSIVRGTGSDQAFTLTRSMDGYHYMPDGMCQLAEVGRRTHTPGQAYTLDHRVLHRADPVSGYPVITAVLQGRDVKDTTTVVPGTVWSSDLAVRPLDWETVARLMETTAERLGV